MKNTVLFKDRNAFLFPCDPTSLGMTSLLTCQQHVNHTAQETEMTIKSSTSDQVLSTMLTGHTSSFKTELK